MTADLPAVVADAYRSLALRCGLAEPAVAVRSSALDEDGATASFAGLFATFLNVAGIPAVTDAVVRCREFGCSGNVARYRRLHGLAQPDAPIAVLVQQLVAADASAVAFSVNPVTGDRGEIVIDANRGMCESIVSGSMTPDHFVVRKAGLEIVERRIAAKQRMIAPSPGGTRAIEMPPSLRTRPSIDDAQVLALARLTLSLEAACDTPVDMECSWRGGILWLLQCRPVTTFQ